MYIAGIVKQENRRILTHAYPFNDVGTLYKYVKEAYQEGMGIDFPFTEPEFEENLNKQGFAQVALLNTGILFGEYEIIQAQIDGFELKKF